jgi:hypothetical protein
MAKSKPLAILQADNISSLRMGSGLRRGEAGADP